ncbi:hypothetical protein N8878_01510 [Psychromonas sp.]|nr:hypothetical protein [Psychromonas sp.]
MFNSPVIKSQFGQHFIIIPSTKINQLATLKAETFIGRLSCEQFIRHLNAPLGYWQQLAQQLHVLPYASWKAQNPWADIQVFIAQALVQGAIKAFKSPSFQELANTSSSRTIKTAFGKRYQIRPASSALLTPLTEPQAINSIAAATQFVEQLALDDETLTTLNASIANTDVATTTEAKRQQLAEAIANGDLVVDLEPEPIKPLNEGEFIEEVVQAAQPEPAKTVAESYTVDSKDAEIGTAKGLIAAAESGAPFCEECEKKQKVA